MLQAMSDAAIFLNYCTVFPVLFSFFVCVLLMVWLLSCFAHSYSNKYKYDFTDLEKFKITRMLRRNCAGHIRIFWIVFVYSMCVQIRYLRLKIRAVKKWKNFHRMNLVLFRNHSHILCSVNCFAVELEFILKQLNFNLLRKKRMSERSNSISIVNFPFRVSNLMLE